MSGAFVQTAVNASNAHYVDISPAAGNGLLIQSVTSSGGGTPTATFTAKDATGGGGTTLATFTVPADMATTLLSGYYQTGAYLLNLPSGTLSISADLNGLSPGEVYLIATEVSGLTAYQAGHRAEQASPGTGTDAIDSGAATCSAIPAYLAAFCRSTSGNGGILTGSAFTSRYNVGSDVYEDRRETGATGSYAGKFTADSTHGGDTFVSSVMIFSESITATIGQAAETDTSQAQGKAKAMGMGQPSEADLAQLMYVNGSVVFLDHAHLRELKDETGAVWANITGFNYGWYDNPDTPLNGGSATATGTFNTNVNGEARVPLPSTGLTPGQTGAMVIRHPNYPTPAVYGLFVLPMGS